MHCHLGLLALVISGTAFAQPGTEFQPDVAPAAPSPATTHATFMSTGETRWDVRIDGNAACTTPCSLYIEPLRYVTLHSQDRQPDKLAPGYLPQGPVLVRAQPRATGAFAAGLTFTTLSGMGLATGITLAAVGCSTERDGMCNAGLITGGASAIGLYLAIGLLRDSLSRVHVERTQPYTTGQTVGVLHRF